MPWKPALSTLAQAHGFAPTHARWVWPDDEVLIATHLDAEHPAYHTRVSDRLRMVHALSALSKGVPAAKGESWKFRVYHEGYTKAGMEPEVAVHRVYLWLYGWGGDLHHRHLPVHRPEGAA